MKQKWIHTLPDSIRTLALQWLSAQPIREDYLGRIWQRFRVEWSWHSNHIEGNSLNYGETLLLLIHGRTKGEHLLREYEEMKGHDVGDLAPLTEFLGESLENSLKLGLSGVDRMLEWEGK